MADDIRKGLGIRRRKPNEDDAKQPERRRTPSSAGPLLGIRRRTGPQAEAAADAADTEAVDVAEAQADAEEAKADAGPQEVSLGDDLTATLLRNHFKVRPELRGKLPDRLFELERTHGRYMGDGRDERLLPVGFKPACVLYVIPPYGYDGMPKFGKGGIVDPGLHRQPTMSDGGFTVDGAFNKVGDMYMYVVFRDDGQPLDLGKKRGRSRGASSSGRSSGPLLGIRRRKKT